MFFLCGWEGKVVFQSESLVPVSSFGYLVVQSGRGPWRMNEMAQSSGL